MKTSRFFAVMAIFVSIVACKETKKDSKATTEVESKAQTEQQITTTEEPKTQDEQQIATEKEGDWKTLNYENFSIQYPSNWVVKKQGKNSKFQIISPRESEKDTFIENCNVTLENVAHISDVNLDIYEKFALKEVKKVFPDMKILKEDNVVNENDTYKMISYKTNHNGTEMIFKQYFTIKNKTVYIFTEVLDASGYGECENIMDKIFSTFKIK